MVTPSWIRPRLPRWCGSCGLAAAALSVWFPARAARAQSPAKYDTSLYRGLVRREVGPYRGGRVTAVAGSSAQPLVYYMGGTGGGVWKTADGGLTWQPVSDKFFTAGSVGAIAVAPSDPNVVYVGTGESPIRGNVSPGDGMYRSTDAGKTWSKIGLADAGQIAHVAVHPQNPDLVYVAVLGHAFAPNPMRGLFRSKDGGKAWEKILFRNDSTGVIDLAMDPVNPRILYAGLWQAVRRPWELVSGGAGSGIFKSLDGGDTWTEITRSKGLPQGTIGKIGLSVSPLNHDRVWALVEADSGGLFRSDDGGTTWSRTSDDHELRQRAWYFTHVFADPGSADGVYVLNTSLLKSVDGGKTFTTIRAPHGDHHALWIDQRDPARMINGNDGGATISMYGGDTWPDNPMGWGAGDLKYRFQWTFPIVLSPLDPNDLFIGAQVLFKSANEGQTWRIVSADLTRNEKSKQGPSGGPITKDNTSVEYYNTIFTVAPSPKDSNVIWAGTDDGLVQVTRDGGKTWQNVTPKDLPEWALVSTVEASPHDPATAYVAATRYKLDDFRPYVYKTSDYGRSWKKLVAGISAR